MYAPYVMKFSLEHVDYSTGPKSVGGTDTDTLYSYNLNMSAVPIIFSGPPSSGKTRVIRWVIAHSFPYTAGVVKLDCLGTDDDLYFKKHAIPSIKILAGDLCPDHYFMEQFPSLDLWRTENKFDVLIIETAGLCGRCAPYRNDAVSVCVLDCTMGIHAPQKVGPLLLDADICVITKGDLVSQAEREVCSANIISIKPTITCVNMNGVTGEGGTDLQHIVLKCMHKHKRTRTVSVGSALFRTALPQMYCSHCLGNTRVPVSAS